MMTVCVAAWRSGTAHARRLRSLRAHLGVRCVRGGGSRAVSVCAAPAATRVTHRALGAAHSAVLRAQPRAQPRVSLPTRGGGAALAALPARKLSAS
jgi:hypothetical protein